MEVMQRECKYHAEGMQYHAEGMQYHAEGMQIPFVKNIDIKLVISPISVSTPPISLRNKYPPGLNKAFTVFVAFDLSLSSFMHIISAIEFF